jgi:hypothetical protein
MGVLAQNSRKRRSMEFSAPQSYRHRHAHALVRCRLPCSRSGCAIATSVARLDPLAVTALVPPLHRRASSRSAMASLGCWRAQIPCREAPSHENDALFNHRTSATVAFSGLPIPWSDGILSKDTQSRFSLAIRMISSSTSRLIRGLPGYCLAFEPSNLWAASLRYQPRIVSGRATVATGQQQPRRPRADDPDLRALLSDHWPRSPAAGMCVVPQATRPVRDAGAAPSP